eukprot:10708672-Alexandrium_andersonii.AAC.1
MPASAGSQQHTHARAGRSQRTQRACRSDEVRPQLEQWMVPTLMSLLRVSALHSEHRTQMRVAS